MLKATSLRRTARKIRGLRATGMITDPVIETTRCEVTLIMQIQLQGKVGL